MRSTPRVELEEEAAVFARAWEVAGGARVELAGALQQPQSVALGLLLANQLQPADRSTLVALLLRRAGR